MTSRFWIGAAVGFVLGVIAVCVWASMGAA